MDGERAKWQAQLERIRDLYKWGDISREEYLKEKEGILKELKALGPAEGQTQNLDKLARFLANVAQAWEEAAGELTTKVARSLFHVCTKRRPDYACQTPPGLEPFFKFNYEEYLNKVLRMRPRGDLNP